MSKGALLAADELLGQWRGGGVTYGVVLRLGGTTWAAEMFSQAGFDFIWIDQQHGFVPDDALLPLLQALNGSRAASLVRVAANDHVLVGKALDAGADGIIIPAVETRSEAEQAVAATRFGAGGLRSHGALRLHYLPGGIERRVICLVMIESLAGVENVQEIVTVPGVDGVFVGPSDLALDMGIPPISGIQDGPHREAILRIRDVCHEHEKVAAITGDAHEMAELGFRAISLGGDHLFMEAGMRAALAKR